MRSRLFCRTSRKRPDDLARIASVTWALDYFPRRDPDLAERAEELREAVLAPLRKARPPPPLPGSSDPDWVEIPAGSFLMGTESGRQLAYEPDEDEFPAHEVTISAFRMLAHEVTNEEFRRLVPDHPGDEELPVVEVSWYAAYAYAAWLGGRLPTEAEWEYAARAGCRYEYCDRNGDETELGTVGWYDENSGIELHAVGKLEPNPWGLYDMLGNAWEWVGAWYGPYSAEPQVDLWGPPGGEGRVVRGGGFANDARWVRPADRDWRNPEFDAVVLGFRVVFPVVPEP